MHMAMQMIDTVKSSGAAGKEKIFLARFFYFIYGVRER